MGCVSGKVEGLPWANKYVRVFAALLFAATIVLLPARAQNISGVRGMVTDSTGGHLWVTIELDNPGRGLHFAATTDELGTYQIQRVPPPPATF